MISDKIFYRIHAIQRMFQRGIAEDKVQKVLQLGEVIEDYSDNTLSPSQLIMGWSGSRPLHVVVAESQGAEEEIVITVYEPGREQWTKDFKGRRI